MERRCCLLSIYVIQTTVCVTARIVLLLHFELLLAYAAQRTYIIPGEVLECNTGFNTLLGVTDLRVIDPLTYCTNILFHNTHFYRLNNQRCRMFRLCTRMLTTITTLLTEHHSLTSISTANIIQYFNIRIIYIEYLQFYNHFIFVRYSSTRIRMPSEAPLRITLTPLRVTFTSFGSMRYTGTLAGT